MFSVLEPPDITESPLRVLTNVSWSTYESMLKELESSSSPHLTYDRGVLEIMSPTAKHEKVSRSIDLFINLVAAEIGADVATLGSTTYKREDLLRGFEPDACFYIENELKIRGKDRIDLSIDPVPDLVVEIDITRSTINKRALFAQFGVPEVWRYDGNKIEILVLEAGDYSLSDHSRALPLLSSAILNRFISESLDGSRREWIMNVREWAQQQAIS
ncbi:MAG TPA: Uma2 family endonuclease [Pyrinomonadaceae bacterium]|nr:Uma2 family endonuclease [Pyrinomonadaceae bacterium]